MLEIKNNALIITMSSDAALVSIRDVRRNMDWILDQNFRGYADKPIPSRKYVPLTPFTKGRTAKVSDNVLEAVYSVPGGEVSYKWMLLEDGVDIQAEIRSQAVFHVSHPGNFLLEKGTYQIMAPWYQGILMRPGAQAYAIHFDIGECVSLSMCGYLGDKGSLVAIQEDDRDRNFNFGQNEFGLFAYFDVTPCAVAGWYQRKTRLYFAENTITSVCKCFRKRWVERGRFVSWEAKIRRKPMVEKLFGSLMAFTGYQYGKNIDYVASAKAVRDFGFETVLYYPLRFNHMTPDILVGGVPWINLSDQELKQIKECGGLVAPWTWTYDALSSKSEVLRHDQAGRTIQHWQIDENIWFQACTSFQIEFVKKQYAGPMRIMDWVHYDVNSATGGSACFNKSHSNRHQVPLSARDDHHNCARLLGPELNGNRIVSSEGFNDFMTQSYDIGSNKLDPLCGDVGAIPIPMTMLVFHDSTVHSWWEVHSYNATHRWYKTICPLGIKPTNLCAEKRAALDALYGSPAHVFPFGCQYRYVGGTKKAEIFTVSIDDPNVQRALGLALPVCRLHKKIGKYEMRSFDFLTDDYAVQTTLYADGTRIVANISDTDRVTSEFGLIKANSWKETR